jgi:hypothetical protein
VRLIDCDHTLIQSVQSASLGCAEGVCDRDFARELADGNAMLGMELKGLFILLLAVIVGAMNYGSG